MTAPCANEGESLLRADTWPSVELAAAFQSEAGAVLQ